MIDKYVKTFSDIFNNYGDPTQNKENYIESFGEKKYKLFTQLYDSYKLDMLRLTIASGGIVPRIKTSYNGNIDELISNIKSDKDLDSKETIFISNEIDNLQHLEKLRDTFKDKEIVVKWNDSFAFIDETIDAKYMIDYYKSLIDDDLSPLEKVTIAYDIVKTFKYNKNEENPTSNISRSITEIVKNDKIVCVGFVNIFNKVLKDLGFKTSILSLDLKRDNKVTSHVRSIVNINDPKYGLEEYFVFDPTWDSSIDRYVKIENGTAQQTFENKEGFKRIDTLSLYNNFLVPFYLYESKFKNSFNEKININGKYANEESVNSILHENQLETDKNFLSASDLANLLYVVRQREGYPLEILPDSIQESLYVSNYGLYDKEDIMSCIKKDEEIKQ